MSVRRVRPSRSMPVIGVVALALVATLLAAGPAPAAVPCTSRRPRCTETPLSVSVHPMFWGIGPVSLGMNEV